MPMGTRQRVSCRHLQNFSSHCETSFCLPDIRFCIGPRFQEESHIRCSNTYRPHCSHRSIPTKGVSLPVKRSVLSAHLPASDVRAIAMSKGQDFPCAFPVGPSKNFRTCVSPGGYLAWPFVIVSINRRSNDTFPPGMV